MILDVRYIDDASSYDTDICKFSFVTQMIEIDLIEYRSKIYLYLDLYRSIPFLSTRILLGLHGVVVRVLR